MKQKILFVLFVVALCVTISGCTLHKQKSKEKKPKYKICEEIKVTESGWHQYVDEDGSSYARYVVLIKNESENTYYNPRLKVHLKSTEDKDVYSKTEDIGYLAPGQTKCFCGKGKIDSPMTHVSAAVEVCKKYEKFEVLKENIYQEIKVEAPSLSGQKVTFKVSTPDTEIKNAVFSVVLRRDGSLISGYDIPVKDYPLNSNEHFVFDIPDEVPEGSQVEVYGCSLPVKQQEQKEEK